MEGTDDSKQEMRNNSNNTVIRPDRRKKSMVLFFLGAGGFVTTNKNQHRNKKKRGSISRNATREVGVTGKNNNKTRRKTRGDNPEHGVVDCISQVKATQ